MFACHCCAQQLKWVRLTRTGPWSKHISTSGNPSCVCVSDGQGGIPSLFPKLNTQLSPFETLVCSRWPNLQTWSGPQAQAPRAAKQEAGTCGARNISGPQQHTQSKHSTTRTRIDSNAPIASCDAALMLRSGMNGGATCDKQPCINKVSARHTMSPKALLCAG